MYGNNDAALKFFKTHKGHLLTVIELTQSKAGPCVFFKKDRQRRILLIAAVFVDDTLQVGI
jgi:CO/xanthine dehydrogenase FAD-binding subunit